MSIRLKTLGMIVKDMGKALHFYRTLGLAIPEDAQAAGEDNFDFEAGDGLVLGFLTEAMAEQSDPKYVAAVGSSLNLQFECESAAEVDTAYARLTGAGFVGYAEPWDAFWGQRFARVTEPDGRIVNLYAAL